MDFNNQNGDPSLSRKIKFLVIDDEPLIRRALLRSLKSRGHVVWEASNGSDGLEVWKKEQPDMIIVDVLMPEMTGPQMVQKAQKLGLQVKNLVFMSAFIGSEQKTLQSLGATSFLQKPFDDLFRVVSELETQARSY